MNNLRVECCFHAVGQGMFYSAFFASESGNSRENFSLVYDCGNKNNEKVLSDEIEKHKQILAPNSKKGKIDLLVLSHFHDDHISGLPKLFECFDVATVVIPYYAPIHLFSYVSECKELNAFFEMFYASPIQYLADCGVKNIVVTGQPMEGDLENRNISFEENDHERERNINNMYFDIRSYASENVNDTLVLYYEAKDINGIKAHKDRLNWEFTFFNKTVDVSKMANLSHFIDGYKTNNGFLDIPSLIKNKEFVRQLKSEYKKCAVDLNSTSMMLYHGPSMNVDRHYEDTTLLTPISPFSFFCETYHKAGTLLTGDIKFGDNEIASIERVVNEIQVFSVPHHGAKDSFDESIINAKTSIYYVISCGLTNNYGHPAKSVIDKMINGENYISIVNERVSFVYTICHAGKRENIYY
jgi:ribonuclease BN (tRNA processing enzyme)